MTEKIIEELIFTKLSSLSWVGRLAGITTLATRAVDIDNRIVKQVYPVASKMTGRDCWEKARYTELTPSAKNTSIMYFEENGKVTIKKDKRSSKYKTSVRLISWMSLAKLGISETVGAYKVIPSLVRDIQGNINIGNGDLYNKVNAAKVSNLVFDSKEDTRNNVFGKYTLGNDSSYLFFYPYDYFSFTFDIEWTIPSGCIVDFVPATEIECNIMTPPRGSI